MANVYRRQRVIYIAAYDRRRVALGTLNDSGQSERLYIAHS